MVLRASPGGLEVFYDGEPVVLDALAARLASSPPAALVVRSEETPITRVIGAAHAAGVHDIQLAYEADKVGPPWQSDSSSPCSSPWACSRARWPGTAATLRPRRSKLGEAWAEATARAQDVAREVVDEVDEIKREAAPVVKRAAAMAAAHAAAARADPRAARDRHGAGRIRVAPAPRRSAAAARRRAPLRR